jgi:hypothetical protein
MLSATRHLTRLDVVGNRFDPDGLAGKSRLQRLCLREQSKQSMRHAEKEYMPRLLSEVEGLQQLTHLDLGLTEVVPVVTCGADLAAYISLTASSTLQHINIEAGVSPTAYNGLTASSKLQHLNIEGMVLPAGVWQHVFPAGRQLP